MGGHTGAVGEICLIFPDSSEFTRNELYREKSLSKSQLNELCLFNINVNI